MKSNTTELVKFKRLQRRLGLRVWQATGVLESCWRFATQNARCGDIGRFSNEDIAAAIEWDRDADELIRALVECGWFDAGGPHRLVVHDWYDHAPQFVTRSVNRQLGISSAEQWRKWAKGEVASQTSIEQQFDADMASQTEVDGAHQTRPSQTRPNQGSESDSESDGPGDRLGGDSGQRMAGKSRFTAKLTEDVLADEAKLRSWFRWQLEPLEGWGSAVTDDWEFCAACARYALARGRHPLRLFKATLGGGDRSKVPGKYFIQASAGMAK